MRVPKEFQQQIKVAYPDGNKPIFEEWFNGWYAEEKSPREYLGVNWTSYYVNNKYGKDERALKKLQHFLNGLDTSKKYFTVLQYDDSILNNVSHLDLKVFGSGGGRIDFPIPLICHPHGRQENERDIFVSFIGSLTHDIRKEMIRKAEKISGSYISTETHDINKFCNILSRSVFALAPRGYGKTSFRICEALEQGAIPVYVSDDFILPEGIDAFKKYGVVIHRDLLPDLGSILRSYKPEEIKYMQEAGKVAYKELYSFEGCRKNIIENI